MGIYHVTVRYDDDTTTEHSIQAVTYDEAWERFSNNANVVGGVVADTVIPENYTIYGLGA